MCSLKCESSIYVVLQLMLVLFKLLPLEACSVESLVSEPEHLVNQTPSGSDN